MVNFDGDVRHFSALLILVTLARMEFESIHRCPTG